MVALIRQRPRYNFNWISRDLALLDDREEQRRILEAELREVMAEELAIRKKLRILRN